VLVAEHTVEVGFRNELEAFTPELALHLAVVPELVAFSIRVAGCDWRVVTDLFSQKPEVWSRVLVGFA